MSPADPQLPPVAVLLAAGLGSRLQAVAGGRPKGFVPIGGETLIDRSVRLLRAAGVRDFVVVTGWRGEAYRAWGERGCPEARWVENADFATTGSLRSLLLGEAVVAEARDVLIVESDLLYEARAPRRLLAAAAPNGVATRDAVLVSGLTASGDEVWIFADARGGLDYMSKQAAPGRAPLGELVGLTRLSAASRSAFRAAAADLPAAAHYEDGLNALARRQPVGLVHVPDLVWCEIDDPAHLARAQTQVWPRVQACDAARLA